MTTLGVISSVLTLLRFFIEYAQKRKWIEEGAAAVLLNGLKDSDDAIAKARSARKSVRDNFARDPGSIMRDDKYTRSGD